MTIFDWLAVVIVAFSAISGALRGMTKTVISSCALLVGLGVALVFYDDFGRAFKMLGAPLPVAYGAGVVLPVIVTGVGGAWLVRVLHRRMRRTPLATLDRLGGGLLGVGRAWLVLSVIYLVLTAFPAQPTFVLGAMVTPAVKSGAQLLTRLGNADLKARFERGIRILRQRKDAFWSGKH